MLVGGGVVTPIENNNSILHINASGILTLIDIPTKRLSKNFFPTIYPAHYF